MTPSLLRLCTALAPIVCWTLLAPASQEPAAARTLEGDPTLSASPVAVRPALPAPTRAPFQVGTERALAQTLHQTAAIFGPETRRAGPLESVHPWRRLLEREITPQVVKQANAIIRTHHDIGHEIPFIVAGDRYLARIEVHYHPPGGDKRPWGPHPGVSVFVARAPIAP